MDKLIDYVMNTPEDAGRTQLCAVQRDQMIKNNMKIMAEKISVCQIFDLSLRLKLRASVSAPEKKLWITQVQTGYEIENQIL